jgi:hypothetical protein
MGAEITIKKELHLQPTHIYKHIIMDLKRLQRSIRFLAIAILISAGSTMRVMEHSTIRAIEFCSTLALGMVAGAFIFSVVLYFRLRKKEASTLS